MHLEKFKIDMLKDDVFTYQNTAIGQDLDSMLYDVDNTVSTAYAEPDYKHIVLKGLEELSLSELYKIMFDKYCKECPDKEKDYKALLKLYDGDYIRTTQEIINS